MGFATFNSTLPIRAVPSDKLAAIKEVTASRVLASQSSPCARIMTNRSAIPDHVVLMKRRYVDNKLNRKLGRVGKEMGTHILHTNGTVCVRVMTQRPVKGVLRRNRKTTRKRRKNNCCRYLNQLRKKRRIQRHRVNHLKKKHNKLMKAINQ